MEKGKGKKEDRVELMLFGVWLAQYVSHCDKHVTIHCLCDRAPPLRAIACWRASIRVDDLVSSCPIFRG